jgi:hypothetical protein
MFSKFKSFHNFIEIHLVATHIYTILLSLYAEIYVSTWITNV